MKQFLTSLLLGLSVLASAQSDGWQYPFPYNPDGNADGFITLNDMLDLLSVYGQEFPGSFYSDTTGAILFLGEMEAHECIRTRNTLQGNWRLPSWEDATLWIEEIASIGSEWFQNGGFTSGGISYLTEDAAGALTHGTVSYYNYSSNQKFGVPYCTGASYPTKFAAPNLHDLYYCFVVTEVHPQFEYSRCDVNTWVSDVSEFDECVTQKLNDGWLPMPGLDNGGGNYRQGFWRIVND